jgi:adenine-specific DNA-methyltransferase
MGCVLSFEAEEALAGAAVRLGAAQVAGWSAAEQRLADAATCPGEGEISRVRDQILAGEDPLGEAFCRLRGPAQRRPLGQTFTPGPVVRGMVGWAARTLDPARVVDPGTGSARFLAAAGRRWPEAALLGVETDPLAAMIGRATLAAAGMAGRAGITVGDYRSLRLAPAAGPTLFLGNPPYVRHHQIPAAWKSWLRSAAASQGLAASGLAGLHVHFFLAIALHAVPGDAGVLVTAAEWLDVNYGSLVRSLLLGPLGGQSVHLLDPAVPAFTDAAATTAITCFRPGSHPAGLRLRRVARLADLGELTGGTAVPAPVLRAASRWTPLAGPAAPETGAAGVTARGAPARSAGAAGAIARGTLETGPVTRAAGTAGRGRLPVGHGRPAAGQVELGELCRVHRGQVTGANKVWVTAGNPAGLPGRFLFPAVTRASELFRAEGTLATTARLRSVIDLPADLGELAPAELPLVTRFLAQAEAAGAAGSYIACHRKPWWRVRLRAPAPILATYMARRPPAFVRNLAGARHVNIAHGLYPREPLPPAALDGLAAYLRRSVTRGQGRTYAGGLTKFEPGEMERLPVPAPALLPAYAPAVPDGLAVPGALPSQGRRPSRQPCRDQPFDPFDSLTASSSAASRSF